MDNENEASQRRADDIYSKSLRAGNRTYFFDVKSTRSEELYLTITESKRRFNKDNGKFYYEKHKLFLYPEDFSSFSEYLEATLEKIKELSGGKEIVSRAELDAQREAEREANDEESGSTEESSEDPAADNGQASQEENDESKKISDFSDVDFDDLGKTE